MPEGAKAAHAAGDAVADAHDAGRRARRPGDDWLHEIKYDGYRMLCRIESGKARLVSRNGKDWTAAFAGDRRATSRSCRCGPRGSTAKWSCSTPTGRTSFQALQNALTTKDAPLSFFAFDLIYLDGYDLRARRADRAQARCCAASSATASGAMRVGPEVMGHGDEFFEQACTLGLEGAVCKRADSPYRDGMRTRDWVKVKCTRRQEMVIGGFTDPQGSRTGFGALLLGVYEDGKLRYAGKVGTGFDEQTLDELHKLLVKREQRQAAVRESAARLRGQGRALGQARPRRGDRVHRMEQRRRAAPSVVPGLARRQEGDRRRARGAASRSRREVRASATRRRKTTATTATTQPHDEAGARRPRRAPPSPASRSRIPDKLYFPEAGITKLDLAHYYERDGAVDPAAHRGSPAVAGPLSRRLERSSASTRSTPTRASTPPSTASRCPEGDGTATYMGASSAKALVALVQWGVLELHPWGSRTPRLDRPDRLIFDFDPDDGVAWKELVTGVELAAHAAGRARPRRLSQDDRRQGPARRRADPRDARLGRRRKASPARSPTSWCARSPTASPRPCRRRGARARSSSTTCATPKAPPRSRRTPCARAPNAPVSMPIAWEELAKDVRFDHFNVRNAESRLAKQKRDPWRDFATTKQTITKAHGKRVGFTL